MGKKSRRAETAEPATPSLLERVFASRPLTIAVGAVVVAIFAGLAILIVTLLGGDDLGTDSSLNIPGPVATAPALPPSAAKDALQNKTWDEMSEDERALVQSEVKRVFDDTVFRARSGFIPAVDVFRRDGVTYVSRQYRGIEVSSGKQGLAEIINFNCGVDVGQLDAYQYILTPIQRDVRKNDQEAYRPAWSSILSGTEWTDVRDLGWKTNKDSGRRVHGLELGFRIDPSVPPTETGRVQYWFDEETAQLRERGTVFADSEKDTEANWYYLSYDIPPPIVLPSDIDKPACVKDFLAKIQP